MMRAVEFDDYERINALLLFTAHKTPLVNSQVGGGGGCPVVSLVLLCSFYFRFILGY